MRIAFDAKRAFFNRTGLGSYCRRVIESLSRFHPEHEYVLFTPGEGPGLFPEIAGRGNVRLATPRSGLSKMLPALWRTLAPARIAEAMGADVYHGLSHELPMGLAAARTRAVVTIHDMLPFTHPKLFPAVDRAVYRTKWRAAVDAADLVVAVSENTRRELVDILGVDPGRVRVAYQSCAPVFARRPDDAAVEEARAALGLEGDYVLYVGALIERKNLLGLVRALALLGRPGLLLAVVGEGKAYKRRAEEEAARLGVADRVRFLGRRDEGDLPALYAGARVFAYPSYSEGFGIPVIESLSMGTPVATSTGSCFAEAGGPGALYVPPGDDAALAAALAKILDDRDLARRLADKGREHAARFSAENTASALMDIYASLARGHA